jgi:uncharacterized protein (DUF983 family)
LNSTSGNIAGAVARLLAGIILVDALATVDLLSRTDGWRHVGLVFPFLFLVTLLLQRVVPAT